jgi:hypothetical protein
MSNKKKIEKLAKSVKVKPGVRWQFAISDEDEERVAEELIKLAGLPESIEKKLLEENKTVHQKKILTGGTE